MTTMDSFFKILSRFKVDDLKNIVIEKFTLLNWEDLLEELHSKRLPLTSRNLAEIFVVQMEREEVSPKTMQRIYGKLTITEISLHSHRRKWQACILLGQGPNRSRLMRCQTLANKISEEIGDNTRVSVIYRNTLYWIMFLQKKAQPKRKKDTNKENELVYQPRMFIALSVNNPYLFAPTQIKYASFIECTYKALNYTSAKRCNLTGNHISELEKSLLIMEGKSVGLARLETQLFKPAKVKNVGIGLDFSQTYERRRYGEEYFGENPPIKKSITFMATGPTGNLTQSSDDNFQFNFTIKSSNVWTTLKKMIEEQLIDFPPPKFYAAAVLQGKDVIKLKAT